MALQDGGCGQGPCSTDQPSGGLQQEGPCAAVPPGGNTGDGQTSIVYDASSGELSLDAATGVELTSINLDSAVGVG